MKDVLVIGGGLAGGAAAALLAQAGRSVRVLERDAEPRHKICGEFLSTEAQRHLAGLGLELDTLGGAPISRLRLVHGHGQVEAALPFTALGLTRRRLDAALLDHAERLGAKVDRGVAVRSLRAEWVETAQGELRPKMVLLASGKHDVRGARRETTGAIDNLIGLKMYFRVDRSVVDALAGFIEVVLFDGGYAGLQLVESGMANLCLLVERERFAEVGRTWPALFVELMREPHIARRLGGAEPLLDRALTIAGVPYGFLRRAQRNDRPDLLRLGDQAAVIPSFSGDGMSIALHSGRLAARAVIEGASAQSYQTRLLADVSSQVRLATGLQRFAHTALGRRGLLAGLALVPRLLGALAAGTRVQEGALRRSGLAA